MTVKEIVSKYLRSHQYDGLFCARFECGCETSDLFPCESMSPDCSPGFKVPCDCGESCLFHIGPNWHGKGIGVLADNIE